MRHILERPRQLLDGHVLLRYRIIRRTVRVGCKKEERERGNMWLFIEGVIFAFELNCYR